MEANASLRSVQAFVPPSTVRFTPVISSAKLHYSGRPAKSAMPIGC
jgi:hypothetical protein